MDWKNLLTYSFCDILFNEQLNFLNKNGLALEL